MIYRECKITPEYVGFAWHHTELYSGPNDDGGSIYAGHSTTIESCQVQIDDMYDEYFDTPHDDGFQLWAGSRM